MKIIYEDKYILILFKEAGKSSQPDKSGEKSLLEEAEEYTGNKLYIMTRLDKPVKGLVLLGKDSKTANKLTEMIQNHDIIKIYHAIVIGKTKNEEHLESYLMKNSRLNISKVVNKGMPGAKQAILDYRLINENENLSKLEINLKTGRHHQIRVQLASIGAPIWGDTKYNPEFRHKRGIFPALCACRLKFKHPVTGEEIDIEVNDELNLRILLDPTSVSGEFNKL